jgi:putative flippase GtrA
MNRLSHRFFNHSFPRYVLVGSIGFVIDAGVLGLLHYQAGWDVMPSRFASFAIAVTATWLLNRLITFPGSRSQQLLAEWFRYTVVNVIGGGLNLAVFAGLVHWTRGAAAEPMIAIVISSLAALAFTYTANRCLVFTTVADENN